MPPPLGTKPPANPEPGRDLGVAPPDAPLWHRSSFFNGNTFAKLGRELGTVLFTDLSPLLRREVTSAIAHHIAGVLDEESLHRLILEAVPLRPLTP